LFLILLNFWLLISILCSHAAARLHRVAMPCLPGACPRDAIARQRRYRSAMPLGLPRILREQRPAGEQHSNAVLRIKITELEFCCPSSLLLPFDFYFCDS